MSNTIKKIHTKNFIKNHAYGAQDVYLTGNPQITFFKVVYRRHTNFALESIQQTFNGSVGYGQRVMILLFLEMVI